MPYATVIGLESPWTCHENRPTRSSHATRSHTSKVYIVTRRSNRDRSQTNMYRYIESWLNWNEKKKSKKNGDFDTFEKKRIIASFNNIDYVFEHLQWRIRATSDNIVLILTVTIPVDRDAQLLSNRTVVLRNIINRNSQKNNRISTITLPMRREDFSFFFLFLERVESVIRIVSAFVHTNVRMYVGITFVKQMMKAKGDCRLSPEFF